MTTSWGGCSTISRAAGVGLKRFVAVWADHGQLLGERATSATHFTLDEELIRVPLIIKPPSGRGLAPGVSSPHAGRRSLRADPETRRTLKS